MRESFSSYDSTSVYYISTHRYLSVIFEFVRHIKLTRHNQACCLYATSRNQQCRTCKQCYPLCNKLFCEYSHVCPSCCYIFAPFYGSQPYRISILMASHLLHRCVICFPATSFYKTSVLYAAHSVAQGIDIFHIM